MSARNLAGRLVIAAGLCLACVAGAAGLQDAGASQAAQQVAAWAARSGDAGGLPFVIVDKRHARVFVFDATGDLVGTAPALLGQALGDVSVPGIGQRKLSTIRPIERTTPAGRFVASLGTSLQGDQILWVDYDSGVALHRVIATAPTERRLQRLASALPSERRITYGCINVPVKFFEEVVLPTFKSTPGIVYVLPETGAAEAVFGPLAWVTAPRRTSFA